MFDVYYAGPQDFDPCNMAYVQLSEEFQERDVNNACDYIRRTYGNELTKDEMEKVFAMYDIDYPLLPNWMKDRFDEFDIIECH